MVSACPHTCDMTPESQMFGVKEGLQTHLLLHSSLLKHISMAINTHTTSEELRSNTEPPIYEVEPLRMETLGRIPQSVQFLCSAMASHWQCNRVQDMDPLNLGGITLPTLAGMFPYIHTLLRLQLFAYTLLETTAKQHVCEDISDCKDLKCAVVISRLWKVVKML